MTFISYAQNLEDVMLWRCFRNVDAGFYIDIGAEDPLADSVTKGFYDRGWSGINIEPITELLANFKINRPRDINIEAAIAEESGILDFWQVSNSGLSTGVKKFADLHKSAGFEVNLVAVKTRTLKDICEEFIKTPIHFMKIDVEGFEKQVLKSADFQKFRPMVLVIESVEPNSQVECYEDWEYILIENNYTMVYADGLNRFYLSREASYLKTFFEVPPNFFDNYLLHTDYRIYKPELNDPQLDKTRLEKTDLQISQKSLTVEELNLNLLTPYEQKRVLMTIGCKDAADIPKVKNAGKTSTIGGQTVQLMHNGLKIVEDCYYGPWMTKIIQGLQGHHEPQEELAFYKVLEYLKKYPSNWGNPRMIELGSFWAYYSMWFLNEFQDGEVFCFEPDPKYLKSGKENFALNDLNGSFIQAMVSREVSMTSEFRCESDGQLITVPALDFTNILLTTGKNEIDIVLVDIQGAEISLLENLSKALSHHKIRFMFISTHGLEITDSPVTHQLALNLLIQNGAHIVVEHSVSESYSGDGFILASFTPEDVALDIPISYNRSKNSLFGEWEPKLETLTAQYEQELESSENTAIEIHGNQGVINELQNHLESILGSKSWKITQPMRTFARILRTFGTNG
jgi:FkbM family methyltransferase